MQNDLYRLDNSAIMYQLILTSDTQSLFRVGVQLNITVDPDTLKKAVELALIRYPFFKTRVRYGLFRPYLNENNDSIIVEQDDGLLLKPINFKHNNRFPFRTTYYDNKIFIDVFHALTDANGAMEFLKTVVYAYSTLIDRTISKNNIRTPDSPIDMNEYEDAFEKYYTKINIAEGIKSMLGNGKAYCIDGRRLQYPGYGLIQGTVNTKKLLEKAHEYNCSLTVFLAALAIHSIVKSNASWEPNKKLIVFIPIDLRKAFPSKTLKNFICFAMCVIPKKMAFTLENIIAEIKPSLQKQLDKAELQKKITFTSLMSRLGPFKFMPMFLKSFVSKIGKNISRHTTQTLIVSNVGQIKLDPNGLVDRFMFNLNVSSKTPDNMAIVSYGDNTVISFTRKIVNTDIERDFFRALADMGLFVKISSNYREDCDAL